MEKLTRRIALSDMIEPIVPAVLEKREQAGNRLSDAVRQGVQRVTRNLGEESSALIIKPFAEGRLRTVSAYHDLSTYPADFFEAV